MILVDINCKILHFIRHGGKTHLYDMPPDTLAIMTVAIARCRASESGRPGPCRHLPEQPVAFWNLS